MTDSASPLDTLLRTLRADHMVHMSTVDVMLSHTQADKAEQVIRERVALGDRWMLAAAKCALPQVTYDPLQPELYCSEQSRYYVAALDELRALRDTTARLRAERDEANAQSLTMARREGYMEAIRAWGIETDLAALIELAVERYP